MYAAQDYPPDAIVYSETPRHILLPDYVDKFDQPLAVVLCAVHLSPTCTILPLRYGFFPNLAQLKISSTPNARVMLDMEHPDQNQLLVVALKTIKQGDLLTIKRMPLPNLDYMRYGSQREEISCSSGGSTSSLCPLSPQSPASVASPANSVLFQPIGSPINEPDGLVGLMEQFTL